MTSEFLSDFQRRKLLHKFELLDIDGNGLIEYKDFQHVIEVLAQQREWEPDNPALQRLAATNEGLWKAIQSFCDADMDGSITQDEWLEYHAQALHRAHEFEQLIPGFETTMAAFTGFVHELLDADGDGVVVEEDYLELSRAHGLDDVKAIRIFDNIDKDRDGTLTLDEVSELVREFYLSDDPEAPGNEFFGAF